MYKVAVRDISILATIGKDCWDRTPKPQPVITTVEILQSNPTSAELTDSIEDAVDYRPIYKAIRSLDSTTCKTLYNFGQQANARILDSLKFKYDMKLLVRLPLAIMEAEELNVEFLRPSHSNDVQVECVAIKGLRVSCIIGVGSHERLVKQPVIIDVELRPLKAVRDQHFQEKVSKTDSFQLEFQNLFEVSKPCETLISSWNSLG
jgi:dihydroneopterin aldolase